MCKKSRIQKFDFNFVTKLNYKRFFLLGKQKNQRNSKNNAYQFSLVTD